MENEEQTAKPVEDKMANRKEISKALAHFQEKCPTIAKDTKGYGYKYADLSTIIETIKPHLKTAKLSYSQEPFQRDGEVGVTTTLFHTETGQYLSSTISLPLKENLQKGMTMVQSMGGIITYLRRYTLSAILGIVTDEDTDGAEPQSPPKKEEPKVEWLSEANLKKALGSTVKGIEATLRTYGTKAKKMKKDYKEQLEAKLKELKTDKNEK